MGMPLKAERFIQANLRSPLEYQSSDGDRVTFRLKDGKTFDLSADEARAIDQAGHLPRWRHLTSFYADAPLAGAGLVGADA